MMNVMPLQPPDRLISSNSSGLTGLAEVPGDKSVSHRSLILASLAEGQTRISGLLTGADVLSTLGALQQLGVPIDHDGSGNLQVQGVGLHGLASPQAPLDLGNAGTGVRLLMGVVAGQPITASFTGDASLSRRPMSRITEPLARMGAQITSQPGGLLPVTISGAETPLPIDYASPVASAQIKSAILLAGLNGRGTTIVTEPVASRDHTESMLRHFGAELASETLADGGHRIELSGEASLRAADIQVPRDPSSAAFLIVAGLITKDSDISLPSVGLNRLRTGLFDTLLEMGADMQISNQRMEGGEPVGDIRVRSSQLKGCAVPAERAASMIDEYPILAVAAAAAEGESRMVGVAELRVKETDRISVMAEGLARCGVEVAETEDSLTVTGTGGRIAGGAEIDSSHDHRIAMSFLTLGLASQHPVRVSSAATIATSFPGFDALLRQLGGDIQPEDRAAR
jgi:3-phosphoshikimate 1-carboxyvinyltransferase